MEVTDPGIVMTLAPEQPLKAPSPIISTEFGMLIALRWEQPGWLKQSLGMEGRPGGIVTVSKSPLAPACASTSRTSVCPLNFAWCAAVRPT